MKSGNSGRWLHCLVTPQLLSSPVFQAAFVFGLVVVAAEAEAGCDASNGTLPQAANSLLVFQDRDSVQNRGKSNDGYEATGRLDTALPRQLHDVIPPGNTRIGLQLHSSMSDRLCPLWLRQRLAAQRLEIPENVKQLAGHTFGQALLFSILVTGLALCVWFYFILGPGREAYKEEPAVPASLGHGARPFAQPQSLYLARPPPGGQTHLAANRVFPPPAPMAGYGGQQPQFDTNPPLARPMTPPASTATSEFDGAESASDHGKGRSGGKALGCC